MSAQGTASVESEGSGGEMPLPSVEEVTRRLDELYRADSSHARMTMSIVTSNWSRTLEMEAWSRGAEEMLVVIRSPAREAGTATLKTEDGLWNYAPRADRLIRVPSGMLSDSWMGSHFTNDDLVRESSYREDYDTSLAWGQEGGRRIIVATLTPKPDAPVVYTRVEFRMTADDWVPLRTEYYDREELVRTMTFSNVEEVDGRRIPLTLTLRPNDDSGEHTTVEYESLEFNVDVEPSLFTQRGLRRAAQRR